MRCINLDELKLPDGWEEKAQKAFDAVKGLTGDARSKAVNAHADVWSELKVALEKLSHDKCWYCESKENRSDNAVDHYRPKGRVAERPDHEGYWWLAFVPENYRFSCAFCNSRRVDKEYDTAGGKQDHFPIYNEKTRVFYTGKDAEEHLLHCDAEEYLNEAPILLDPTVAVDTGLLWYEEDGKIIAKYQGAGNDWLQHRAEISIELYHLNHRKLKRKRNAIFIRVKRIVKQSEVYWKKHRMPGDSTAKQAVNERIHELQELISAEAEHSAAVRALLKRLSRNHEWLEQVFTTV